MGGEVNVEKLNIEYPSIFEVYHRADYMSLMEISGNEEKVVEN